MDYYSQDCTFGSEKLYKDECRYVINVFKKIAGKRYDIEPYEKEYEYNNLFDYKTYKDYLFKIIDKKNDNIFYLALSEPHVKYISYKSRKNINREYVKKMLSSFIIDCKCVLEHLEMFGSDIKESTNVAVTNKRNNDTPNEMVKLFKLQYGIELKFLGFKYYIKNKDNLYEKAMFEYNGKKIEFNCCRFYYFSMYYALKEALGITEPMEMKYKIQPKMNKRSKNKVKQEVKQKVNQEVKEEVKEENYQYSIFDLEAM